VHGGGVALATPNHGGRCIHTVAAHPPELHEAVALKIDLKHGTSRAKSSPEAQRVRGGADCTMGRPAGESAAPVAAADVPAM
jgi:hypothetical protein